MSIAPKPGADIWKRDDVASGRGVGRYQARIDAAKNGNGAHRLLQRRDAQLSTQTVRTTSRNLARLCSAGRADRLAVVRYSRLDRRNSSATEA
jgi:hypothetical protein